MSSSLREALARVRAAERIIKPMLDRGSYTTGEIQSARKTLFEAINALDSYILVPEGEYRKHRR